MKNFKKINSTTIMLDNKKYKGYTVGELPKTTLVKIVGQKIIHS